MSSSKLLTEAEQATKDRNSHFETLLSHANGGGPKVAWAYIQKQDCIKTDYFQRCKKARSDEFIRILNLQDAAGGPANALIYLEKNKFGDSHDPNYESLALKARQSINRQKKIDSGEKAQSPFPQYNTPTKSSPIGRISTGDSENNTPYQALPDAPSTEAKEISLSQNILYEYFVYRSLRLAYNKTAPLKGYLEYFILFILVPLIAAASSSTMFSFAENTIETPEDEFGKLNPETHLAFFIMIGICATTVQAFLSANSNFSTEISVKRKLGIPNPENTFKKNYGRMLKACMIVGPTCIPTSIFSIDAFPSLAFYQIAILCIFRSGSAFVINYDFFNQRETDKREEKPRSINYIHALLAVKKRIDYYRRLRPDDLIEKLAEKDLLRHILEIKLNDNKTKLIDRYETILKNILNLLPDVPLIDEQHFIPEPERKFRAALQHELHHSFIPWLKSFLTKKYIKSLKSWDTVISLLVFYTALTINFRAATTIGKHVGMESPEDIPGWFLGLFSSNPSLALNCWFWGTYVGGLSLFVNWIIYKTGANRLVKAIKFVINPISDEAALENLVEEKRRLLNSNASNLALLQSSPSNQGLTSSPSSSSLSHSTSNTSITHSMVFVMPSMESLSPEDRELFDKIKKTQVSGWRSQFHDNFVRVVFTSYSATCYGGAQGGSSVMYPFLKGDDISKVTNLIFNFFSMTSLGFMSIDAAFSRGRDYFYKFKYDFVDRAIENPHIYYFTDLKDLSDEFDDESIVDNGDSSLVSIPDLADFEDPDEMPERKNLFSRFKTGSIHFFKKAGMLIKESFIITNRDKREAFVCFGAEVASHTIEAFVEAAEDLRDPFVPSVMSTPAISLALAGKISSRPLPSDQTAQPVRQYSEPRHFSSDQSTISPLTTSKRRHLPGGHHLSEKNSLHSSRSRSPGNSKQNSPNLPPKGNPVNEIPDAMNLSLAANDLPRRGSRTQSM